MVNIAFMERLKLQMLWPSIAYITGTSLFLMQKSIPVELHVVNHQYEWVEKAIVFRPELKNWHSAVRDGLVEAGIDP